MRALFVVSEDAIRGPTADPHKAPTAIQGLRTRKAERRDNTAHKLDALAQEVAAVSSVVLGMREEIRELAKPKPIVRQRSRPPRQHSATLGSSLAPPHSNPPKPEVVQAQVGEASAAPTAGTRTPMTTTASDLGA